MVIKIRNRFSKNILMIFRRLHYDSHAQHKNYRKHQSSTFKWIFAYFMHSKRLFLFTHEVFMAQFFLLPKRSFGDKKNAVQKNESQRLIVLRVNKCLLWNCVRIEEQKNRFHDVTKHCVWWQVNCVREMRKEVKWIKREKMLLKKLCNKFFITNRREF